MQFPNIAERLLALQKNDLCTRQKLTETGELWNGYHPQMEAVHVENAVALEAIIKEIGYPNETKVGNDASQAAWLIIQHAISLPKFMKQCHVLADIEAANGNIDPLNVAYLSDRIAMYENRPQRYGTQFTYDENGDLTPYAMDAEIEVINSRRAKLGLNTIDERLATLTHQAKVENTPKMSKEEHQKHQKTYTLWQKKVGWIA